MNDGPRGCWTGSQIEEGKEEDQEEPGERIYKQRWNGEICIVQIGKTENYGMQDAENGDSCKNPALYIYIYIYMNYNHPDSYSESMSRRMVLHFLGGTASNHEKPVKYP